MKRAAAKVIDRRYVLTAVLTVGLGGFSRADEDFERIQLTALLRQLSMLDRTAQQCALSATPSTRYRFDYARLHADLARIRSGIEDYLSPPRAQPRDPLALNGAYRIEQAARP